MKNLVLSLILLHATAGLAAEKFRAPEPLLTVTEANRKPASLPEDHAKQETNEEVFQQLGVGSEALTQNSFGQWNDEVVKVTEIFDDKSVRIKYPNGRAPLVKFHNLARNLSLPVPCLTSHGTAVCQGDRVLYPLPSASLMIPEAEVRYAFSNGKLLLRDGDDFLLSAEQVGKSVECSPQRPTICLHDHVLAEGFKDGSRHVFEGTIEKAYTHGPVLVRVSPTLLIPIDVSAVKKRVAAEAVIDDPAVISEHSFTAKPSYTVLPEVEPLDPKQADKIKDAR